MSFEEASDDDENEIEQQHSISSQQTDGDGDVLIVAFRENHNSHESYSFQILSPPEIRIEIQNISQRSFKNVKLLSIHRKHFQSKTITHLSPLTRKYKKKKTKEIFALFYVALSYNFGRVRFAGVLIV